MTGSDIAQLVSSLAAQPGTASLANPYSSEADPGASIRRGNLTRYLEDMARRRPAVLLLAEAPGYRGCRLSGIPVTSERIMLRGIARWGLFGDGYRPTSGDPQGVAEMTATILWGALVEMAPEPPLIWNTVPLHPHNPDNPQSNRTPTSSEVQMGTRFVQDILDIFSIETIAAVGRTARRALDDMGCSYTSLRHPSQGGKAEFIAGLRRLYGGHLSP